MATVHCKHELASKTCKSCTHINASMILLSRLTVWTAKTKKCEHQFDQRFRETILSSGMHFLIEAVSEVVKERDEKRTAWNWCDPKQSLSWESEVRARECSTAKPFRRTLNRPPALPTQGQRGWLAVQETGLSLQSRATDCLHTQMGTSGTRWCLLERHQPHAAVLSRQQDLKCLIVRVKMLKLNAKSEKCCLILCQKLWYNHDLICLIPATWDLRKMTISTHMSMICLNCWERYSQCSEKVIFKFSRLW